MGQSFTSWRHLIDLIEDPHVVDMESTNCLLDIFGLVLNIWHLIVWHICWHWCLIFFYQDLIAIDPLFVLSWGNLQAALWFR
jgi:hypothetical protein